MINHYIVNLSTISTASVPAGIKAFTELCNKYSTGMFSCHETLFRMTNYAWLQLQLAKHEASLYSQARAWWDGKKPFIVQYKLGEINTEDFLDKMLDEVFPFMKTITEGSSGKSGRELVAEAWNAVVSWDDECSTRLHALLTLAATEGASIHFISNTNPLNMQKNAELLNMHAPREFRLNVDTLENHHTNTRCSFHTSYGYGAMKTSTPGTPGLVEAVVQEIRASDATGNITLVSQFNGDIQMAEGLKDPALITQRADEFFKAQTASQAQGLPL